MAWVAQMVKKLLPMQENWVWFLDKENTLEKGMATHSRYLSRVFHEQRSLVGYSLWSHEELDATNNFTMFMSEYV